MACPSVLFSSSPAPADLNFLYLSSRLLEWVSPDLARTSLSGAPLLQTGCACTHVQGMLDLARDCHSHAGLM